MIARIHALANAIAEQAAKIAEEWDGPPIDYTSESSSNSALNARTWATARHIADEIRARLVTP